MATKNIVGTLVYKITGDSSLLDKSLDSSKKKTTDWGKAIKTVLGIGGAVAVFKTLTGAVKDMLDAYSAQEQAEIRLAAAIRATGGDVDTLMGQYIAFASEIQAVTTVGDEQTLALIQQGESLGIARDKMQEATKGAIGLSKAFGIDMNTAMRGIALAYEGNYAQLSRYIPALRTAGDEAERQAILQEAMANGFQIATAEAMSGTGALLQLNNSIGDLKEEGGRMILEFLTPSIRSLSDFVTKTVAAIAETNRLKEIAEKLSEGKKVTLEEQIALIDELIKHEEWNKKAAEAYTVSGEVFVQKRIDALKAQKAALVDAARWEKIEADENRKRNTQAAADAAAEAQRAKDLAEWIKKVNDEYDKTEEGQRKILEASIAKWEYELTQANVYKPQIQTILDKLYEQRDAMIELADTSRDFADVIEAQAQMQEDFTNLDLALTQQRIEARKKEAEEEIKAAEEAKAKREQVELRFKDFMVEIWGNMDALFRARLSAELAALDEQHRLELESFKGTEEERAALIEEYEKERKELEYEAAYGSWKLQVVGGIAAMARAILESMKLGFPWAIPMVAMATIQGAIQIAAIKAAEPIKGYATGADFIVPPGYPDDSYPMRVESGERVVVEPRGGAVQRGNMILQLQIDGKLLAESTVRYMNNGVVRVRL